MKTKNNYVGLDVHKDTTVIAVADGGRDGEVRLYGDISSDLGALEKGLRKLGGDGVTLHVVYEAGPTGFVVYRRLQQLGIECIVVAPTKTPQEKGLRQKTDRRDALLLARLHRAGNSPRSTCRTRSTNRSATSRARGPTRCMISRARSSG